MFNFVRLLLAGGTAVAAAISSTARPGIAQTPTAEQPRQDAGARAADRWQLTVDSAQYLWDVRLVKLAGDTLVVRQADSLLPVAVGRISEIRLLQKSTMQVGTGGRDVLNALTGADDEIYDLGPLAFAERLRVIQKLLLSHPPGD